MEFHRSERPRLWRRRRFLSSRCWAACLAAALLAPAVQAAEDTLVRLAQTGRIVLGVNDSIHPITYMAPSGAHVGYHLDVCMRIVKAIQQKFDLPNLNVVMVPTTAPTRFALLNNRTTDIECGPNPVRGANLSQALLAHATVLMDIRLMTTTASKDMSLANLAGRSVGFLAGTPGASVVRLMARRGDYKITEVFGRNPTDVFALLESGRADGVILSATALMSQRMMSPAPERLILSQDALLAEPAAIAFRLGDEALVATANAVIDSMMKSGEMARLYDKWYMQPIPGLPVPLGLPLPAALRALFDAPGSEMQRL